MPFLCTVLYLLLQGIVETSRIVGPLSRLRTLMQGLRRGRIPGEFMIREKDYLHDLSQDCDRTLKFLHNEISSLQSLSHQLHTRLQTSANGSPASAELRALVTELDQRLQAFELDGSGQGASPEKSVAGPVVEPLEETETVSS